MVTNNLKLLIVDDEKDICELIQPHFKHRGFCVFIANSAKEAIPVVKENSPEIMLLDKRMPDVNGIELLKNIRQFNQDVKVIMVSADLLDSETKAETEKLGLLAYLHKPFNISELDAIIEKETK